MSSVTIIDSGICNLFNVKRAFESIGAEVVITRSKEVIMEAQRVVLPGVGAFRQGMQSLNQYGLAETLQAFAKSGRPLFGICLGMQKLMSYSEEFGMWNGLGIIEGRVRRFCEPSSQVQSYKIPQIGWNTLEEAFAWDKTVLDGIGKKPYVYFVHSYIVEPVDKKHCLAYTNYGQDKFCSVIKRDNVSGCQFHPERSGEAGLKILRNFLAEK